MKVEDIKKIAVMGAGDMGHGIAEVALLAGYKVALRDIEQRFVDRGTCQNQGEPGQACREAEDHRGQ